MPVFSDAKERTTVALTKAPPQQQTNMAKEMALEHPLIRTLLGSTNQEI